MEWYKKCWRKYGDFTGRARRTEYWMFHLGTILLWLIAMILDMVLGIVMTLVFGWYFPMFGILAYFSSILPMLAVTVRRLHDTNRSGWYLCMGLLPIIGSIFLLVAILEDGTFGENQYGKDPKSADREKQFAQAVRLQAITVKKESQTVDKEIVPKISKEDHSRFMPGQN